MYRGRHSIPGHMRWIDHLQQGAVGEPQSSVQRSCAGIKVTNPRLYPVRRIKNSHLQPAFRLSPPALHLVICDLDQTTLSVKPQVALIVRNEGIDAVARQTVADSEDLLFSVLPSDNSECSRS